MQSRAISCNLDYISDIFGVNLDCTILALFFFLACCFAIGMCVYLHQPDIYLKGSVHSVVTVGRHIFDLQVALWVV